MSKITTRVSEFTEKWLETHMRNKTAGAEYILDAFPTLYGRALAEMKGKFSGNELALLVDALNGTMLTPQLAGQHVVLAADNSMTLARTDVKWNVDSNFFMGRLQALSHFERVVLELFIRAFWESPETGDGLKNPGALEAWVLKIASSPINHSE